MGILALDAFVYVAALAPGGGPENSTLVMSQQLFTTAFTKGQFGYACAMGVVLAVITLAYAGLVFVVNRLDRRHQRGGRMTGTTADVRDGSRERPPGVEPPRSAAVRRSTGDKVVGAASHTRADHLVPARRSSRCSGCIMSSFKTSSEIFASPFALPANWNFDNYAERLDHRRDRQLLPQLGDRGVRRADRDDAVRVDVGVRAGPVHLPGQPAALLPDAGRADVPGVPGDRAAVLRAAGDRAAEHAARADPDLRGVRVPVHGVLPLRLLPDRCRSRSPRRRRWTGRGSGGLLPDHAADGPARPGHGGDLELRRAVEPVPAAGGAEHQHARTTC